MTAAPPRRVGVIGAGLMGHGIAQTFAAAGAKVNVFDPDDAALATLRDRIEANLEVVGGDLDAAERVSPVGSIEEAAEGAELVVEAAPEHLEIKRRIFAELDRTPRATIVASNTSVLSIGEVVADAVTASRMVGTHWWNPPYLVPLVEVIQAPRTGVDTVGRTISMIEGVGKTAVHVRRDVPGFVGNRLQHAMWREALSLIDAGVCGPETIDTVVRAGFGGRLPALGPVENADLVGLDLIEAIHTYLLPHLDASTKPARGLRERVARGELGAKSGRGYLEWDGGRADVVRERMVRQIIGADRLEAER